MPQLAEAARRAGTMRRPLVDRRDSVHRWYYITGVIDQFGQVIDLYVSSRRDGAGDDEPSCAYQLYP